MNIGMLWFDGDRKVELGQRIERAAGYYRSKYGQRPNVCFVHPATVNGDAPKLATGIEVRTSLAVLPDHFWLGVEEAQDA